MLRLTHAPLPSWSDFLRMLPIYKVREQCFLNAWRVNNEKIFCLSRSTWSIKLIAKTWQAKNPGKELCVWLPDYFCNSALSELRRLKPKLIFYSLDEDLNPKSSSFSALAKNNAPSLFILVHYFGREAASEEVKDFCKAQNCWLIEDATHVLCPNGSIGQQGDFILYSPYKHLALPNGALLITRQEGPSNLSYNFIDEISKQHQALICEENNSLALDVFWSLKRLAQKVGIRKKDQRSFEHEGEDNIVSVGSAKISVLSIRLLKSKSKELDKTYQLRTKTATLTKDLLVPLINQDELSISSIEHYPYLISLEGNKKLIKHYYQTFQKIGLPVSTWPDLPKEVIDAESSFAKEHRDTRFFVIPQAKTSKKQLNLIFRKALKDKIKNWKMVELTEKEWQSLYNKLETSCLLQAAQYGKATAKANNLKVHWVMVMDDHNNQIAICQILTRVLPIIGKVARINRGPLLLCGQNNQQLPAIFCLMKELKRKGYKFIKAAFELTKSQTFENQLNACKFIKSKQTAWGSASIDLTLPSNVILQGFKGKWRNGLRKAEKLNVMVKKEALAEQNLSSVISWYESFQAGKQFTGISKKLLTEFSKRNTEDFKSDVFFALNEQTKERLGMVLTLTTGNTSTYLIGVSNTEGRKSQVNSLLLWQAILEAKAFGARVFDVGGLNEDTPEGIAKFKRGLNAKPYQLTGEWSCIPHWTMI